MKKHLLILAAALMMAVCVQARIIIPEENQVWWGYFNESDFKTADYTIGTGSAMTLMAAIYVPANHEQLGEATIMGARVYLASSAVSSLSDLKIWISKTLPNTISDAEVIQTTLGTLSAGVNDYKLNTPYEVNNEGFYIGYCVKSTTGYFIRSGGTDATNAFWIGNPEAGMGWTDLNGYGLGKLAFQILVENANFPNNCATAEDFGQNIVLQGEEASIPITITNMGQNPIETISYTISTDGGNTTEEKEISMNSLLFNSSKTVNIPFSSDAEARKYQKTFTITQVNGNPNTASKSSATGFLISLKEKQPVTPVIEEFDATWCGWCPRGMVGMEKVHETYGDQVVQIVIHSSDPMEISAYSSILDTFCNGFPGSVTDRMYVADPSFSFLESVLTTAFNRVAPAAISLYAQWDSDAKEKVIFNTTTHFSYSDDNGQYAIAFVLTEDGLTGTGSNWAQANYYSGQGTGDMAWWGEQGSSVSGVEFNYVAVAGWEVQNGVNGSINPTITAGEDQKFSYTAAIPTNSPIQDKTKLKAVALLIDRTNGTIVNATQSAIADVAIINNIYYLLDAYNGTAEVIKNPAGYTGTVIIPVSVTYNDMTYTVTSIGANAFSGCSDLTSITIPESVTNIGSSAFSGCYGLTSITIPNSVTNIGSEAFIGCGLTSVSIPNSMTSISHHAFYGCSSLTSITIPNSITSIGFAAFAICSSLPSITIPNSVTTIGDYAFYDCNGLTDVYCLANEIPETASNVFHGFPTYIENATLHVPEGSLEIYKTSSPWSGFGSIVALTSPIEEVVDEADWTLLKLAYTEMGSGEGWNKKWIFNDESHSLSGLDGVTLSNDGHVTSIDLSSNNLTGAFPFTLLNLPYLKTLDISGNQLTGNIGLTMAAFKQKNPSKTFAIQKLDISDNKFSGNIGLFANCFTNLTSLNASGNCLEDVYPMIPAIVTSLDLSRQAIARVVPLHLGKLSVADIGTKVPTILLYDHVNRTFSTNISMLCTTPDEQWGMSMVYQNGQLSVPYVSEQNTYYGESGDTLNVAVLNSDGTREGSTFRISLSFDEGDSNFDGQINVLDLQANIMYIMEKYLTRPYNFTAANLWSDGLINVQDIIRLVDLLINMEPTESAFSAKRKVQGIETGTIASISIQNGQIVLNSDEPVAAMDLHLSNASSIEVADNLERLGMSVITKETTDGLHIIAYSMSGNCIPLGISTIGIIDSDAATVSSVMLSDSEANAISVSIDNDATGIHSIENGKLIIDNENAVYDLSGRQIVNGRLKRGVYIKNGHKIAK